MVGALTYRGVEVVPDRDIAALFDWAQACDLALFPIKAYSKQPTGIVQSHVFDWSKEPARWLRWYRENNGCNFGVSCGPSNIIVIDVDRGGEGAFYKWCADHGAEQIVSAPTVISPTGGMHFYFRVPPGVDSETLRQPNLCGKEVNVRAGHGYVVSPFSTTDQRYDAHVKGSGAYRLHQPTIYQPWAPIAEHCLPTREEGPTIRPDEQFDFADDGLPTDAIIRDEVVRRIQPPLNRLSNSVPGERNEQLNRASFDLGKIVAEGKLAEWAAVDLLQTFGERAGIPRDEAKARSTIRSGLRSAPRVGRPEPRSAMMSLLAAAVPVAPVKEWARSTVPKSDSLVPLEPLVERLLYRGQITMLSGGSGTGKTTFIASLMASSVAGIRDFKFGEFAAHNSDLLAAPACWIFISYEGGQHIQRTMAGWYAGTGCPAKYLDRVKIIEFDDGCLVSTSAKRDVVVNEAQAKIITDAILEMREKNPDIQINLVIDNATTAVENCMDPVQAQRFGQCIRHLARQDIAIVVLAHPPKSGSSDLYGSHLYYTQADIVGVLEVLKQSDGEWTQWIAFPKHRDASNNQCLEIRSRRMLKPIVELPPEWGATNPRARARQIAELHIPYVFSLRVRKQYERESIEKGVTRVDSVSPKAEDNFTV